MNRPFKAVVCAITLVAFLFTVIPPDLAHAAGTPSKLVSVGSDRAGGLSVFKDLNVSTFSLPQNLGTVKDSWFAQNPRTREPANPQTIIHIQDAHCNYYAQRKISEIIDYLNKEYGVNTVNLEGGAKGYDISIFTDIKQKDKRAKVSDYFVKEGLVNGAEYFAINNPGKINLWGVEDVGLYIDNLKVYRESLAYKDEAENYLRDLSRIISALKIKIYSKELLELDSRYSAYKVNNAGFKDYLSYLIDRSKEKLIDIKAYINIYLLNQALGQEQELDFRKANDERDQLVDRLERRLSKKSLEELVMKTVEFKAEKISQADFYRYLTDKAVSVGIDLSGFGELKKYSVYVSIYQALDKSKITEEVEEIEGKLKSSLFRNSTDKELDTLSKNLALLKNMFSTSLTSDDYEYYKKNERSFRVSNFKNFIECEAPRYNIDAKLDKNIAKLDDYRQKIAKFYEHSFKRDRAFVKNVRLQAVGSRVKGAGRDISLQPTAYNPQPKRMTILITGGFHTENLTDLFRKQGISYVSIIPNFKNSNGYDCPYFKILSGENTMWIANAMPSVLSNSLATIDQLNPEMVNAAEGAGLLRPDLQSPVLSADIDEAGPSAVELPAQFDIKDANAESLLMEVLSMLPEETRDEIFKNVSEFDYPSRRQSDGAGFHYRDGTIAIGACYDPLYFLQLALHELSHSISEPEPDHMSHKYCNGFVLYLMYPEQFRALAKKDGGWAEAYEFYKKIFKGKEYTNEEARQIHDSIDKMRREETEKVKSEHKEADFNWWLKIVELQRTGLAQIQDLLDEAAKPADDGNRSCGTICDTKHEGSYNALDEQLRRQFDTYKTVLKDAGIKTGEELNEDEADEALVRLMRGLKYAITTSKLASWRNTVRREALIPAKVKIYFSLPEGGTELFWVDNDYAAGHVNREGTRIHLSPLFMMNTEAEEIAKLKEFTGLDALISVAEHEKDHMVLKKHTEINEGLQKVINAAIKRDKQIMLHDLWMRITENEGWVKEMEILEAMSLAKTIPEKARLVKDPKNVLMAAVYIAQFREGDAMYAGDLDGLANALKKIRSDIEEAVISTDIYAYGPGEKAELLYFHEHLEAVVTELIVGKKRSEFENAIRRLRHVNVAPMVRTGDVIISDKGVEWEVLAVDKNGNVATKVTEANRTVRRKLIKVQDVYRSYYLGNLQLRVVSGRIARRNIEKLSDYIRNLPLKSVKKDFVLSHAAVNQNGEILEVYPIYDVYNQADLKAISDKRMEIERKLQGKEYHTMIFRVSGEGRILPNDGDERIHGVFQIESARGRENFLYAVDKCNSAFSTTGSPVEATDKPVKEGADHAFEGGAITEEAAERIWTRAVAMGTNLPSNRLGDDFTDWFKNSYGSVPIVKMLPQKEMDAHGAKGKGVIRYVLRNASDGNNIRNAIVISKEYYRQRLSGASIVTDEEALDAAGKGIAKVDPLLNTLSHETIAHVFDVNNILALDAAMYGEGVTGLNLEDWQRRRARHTAVRDRAMAGEGRIHEGAKAMEAGEADGAAVPEYTTLVRLRTHVDFMGLDELKQTRGEAAGYIKWFDETEDVAGPMRDLIRDLQRAVDKAIKREEAPKRVILVQPRNPEEVRIEIETLEKEISALKARITTKIGTESEMLKLQEELWKKRGALILALKEGLDSLGVQDQRVSALKTDALYLIDSVKKSDVRNGEMQLRMHAAGLQMERIIAELTSEYSKLAVKLPSTVMTAEDRQAEHIITAIQSISHDAPIFDIDELVGFLSYKAAALPDKDTRKTAAMALVGAVRDQGDTLYGLHNQLNDIVQYVSKHKYELSAVQARDKREDLNNVIDKFLEKYKESGNGSLFGEKGSRYFKDIIDLLDNIIAFVEDRISVEPTSSEMLKSIIQDAMQAERNRLIKIGDVVVSRPKVEVKFDEDKFDRLLEGTTTNVNRLYLKASIYNVLKNAVNHADGEDVEIRVGVEEKDGVKYIGIKIVDHGNGIASDSDLLQWDSITGRFKLYNLNAKGADGGTGLGLCLAWNVMKDNKGSISHESRWYKDERHSMDHGMTFTLRIPAAKATVAQIIEERKEAIVAASSVTDGRDSIVKTVVGLPEGDGFESPYKTVIKQTSGILAKKGYGVVEADMNRGSRECDDDQVYYFTIYKDDIDGKKTRANMAEAMSKAEARLAEQGGKGRLVLYAPEMENGPRLLDSAKTDYSKKAVIIPDAYTDSMPARNALDGGAQSYPDVISRIVLARILAFYYDGTRKSETFELIKSLLEKITSDPTSSLVIKDGFLEFLRPVRIRPVRYEAIRDWQRSQEELARSL